ncbi:unnamed protein product [Toxocara canis]|uniref:Peptidase S1 domain-containing protein n=1 Tax=Toxocara canis TaxID=6265 RepID=A0A183UU87_TOXCA|nr:unnamed protein product [Toxocara canis]
MRFFDIVVLALTLVWVEKEALAFTVRVAFGTVTDPEMYPYVVKIITKNYWDLRTYTCTGSLVSRSVILTAGHCVSNAQVANFAQFKKLKGLTTVAHKTIRTTGRVFALYEEVFPIYSPITNVTKVVHADVGLISLNEALPICESKNGRLYSVLQLPIADPSSDEWTSHIDSFEHCKLLGYGDHERGVHKSL